MMAIEKNVEALSLQLARQKAMQTQIMQVHQSTIYGIDQPWIVEELCADEHIAIIRTQGEFTKAMQNPTAKRLLVLQSAELTLDTVAVALQAQPQTRIVFMELV